MGFRRAERQILFLIDWRLKLNLQIEYREVKDLLPYARNSRTHSDAQVAQIAASVREFGWTNPVLVDGENGIIAGHGRVLAARKLGMDEVPCIELAGLSDTQRRAYIIADNKLALNAGWDDELLAIELHELNAADFDMALIGFDAGELSEAMGLDEELDGDSEPQDEKQSIKLTEEFGFAPFSVLDTRRGEWMQRKAAWRLKIGDNGESRENTLFKSSGNEVSNKMQDIAGVSILDPVMAEIITHWFGTKGGVAFDPFAGDSVFGFVSATSGMVFRGIELRKEQADLNQKRVDEAGLDAKYHNDTSENMDAYIAPDSVDLVFSCPPYADLEVYSDDARDLSNMSHDDFFAVYARILQKTYATLKNNRFAVIVMGEVRGKNGAYLGTIPKTIAIMEGAGYRYYNEIILVNSVGTLALRAGRQMKATRKIGKTHQNILVFVKGDPSKAVKDLGDISIPEIEEEDSFDGE